MARAGRSAHDIALDAIRGDHWLAIHADAPATTRSAIKRAIRDAFYDEREDWMGQVLGQSRTSVLQAVMALSSG